jgi:hypothetical protein
MKMTVYFLVLPLLSPSPQSDHHAFYPALFPSPPLWGKRKAIAEELLAWSESYRYQGGLTKRKTALETSGPHEWAMGRVGQAFP